MPSFVTDDGSQAFRAILPDPHRPSYEKQSIHSSLIDELPNGHVENGSGPGIGIGTGLGAVTGPRAMRESRLTDPLTDTSSYTTYSIPNGRPSRPSSTYTRDVMGSRDGSMASNIGGAAENGSGSAATAIANTNANVNASDLSKSAPPELSHLPNGRPTSPGTYRGADMETPPIPRSTPPLSGPPLSGPPNGLARPVTPVEGPHSHTTPGPHRFSSPPAMSQANLTPGTSSTSSTQPSVPPQLRHRHTLQVPKLSTSRSSRESVRASLNPTEDVGRTSGRFSPTASGPRRTSVTLGRRTTRSIHSDMHLDEIPQDEDAARWSEAIRQKRASKRRRKEEEDDDRVVVGIKVDQHHVNWVTAYNMLTGIRFTVSRTNAKLDRALTDADFDAKHKFSFDITGNELTPSARYDFKFKDYAPWVFRKLRAKFRLDPADYLMSLTSKYILSELGSPGKSGSFFYFSRDYKYIIKTIHHTEHKLLRKILRQYYDHVESNPNTLLSQFYGLHRVKIPYGKKIHFVVMNNLFPPHRDIHRTFDLKGSTIGRDFKEEDLEKNPRATLKDLNWLRRNLRLEFGPAKKNLFIEQMHRDVRLLQRLNIMDYSLLVGIHDLEKGNEENLRDKTLQIFQPGGERGEEPMSNVLMRTPSKVENARKARELRQIIKKEKPIPLDQSTSKMPDEMLEERKHFTFYGDDGGFRATHEDNRPGEEIYYLGIIDCLTNYGVVKKAEHFWKGLSSPKSQISPIPPEGYGERFIRFITGITKSREEKERERLSAGEAEPSSLDMQRLSGHLSRSSTDKVMDKAEKQARQPDKDAVEESEMPERTLGTVRSPSAERTNGLTGATLPVVEEAGEGGSTSGRSRDESVSHDGATRDDRPNGSVAAPTTAANASIHTQSAVTVSLMDGEGAYTRDSTVDVSVVTPEDVPDDLSFRIRDSFYLTGPVT
ncbi:MAG: Phosphatidylinositol-4-phosphate 5-kinase [Thelocarpon superellum]|nr:MAG: Phosphatidylinositol-4-phosphate 5-kinase [Thelocarpon superellum]